jgi:dihydrofolate reductase
VIDAEAASPRRRPIALVHVVAMAENRVIGNAGRLPWRLKSELRHFRSVTMGKPLLMGRKTFSSIGKPLAGRTNIVLSRDPKFASPGLLVANTLDAALTVARGDALRRGVDEICVIGGADIYVQTMPVVDRLIVTLVHLDTKGDVRFPQIDSSVWKETSRSEHAAGPDDEASFTIIVYEKSGAERAL